MTESGNIKGTALRHVRSYFKGGNGVKGRTTFSAGNDQSQKPHLAVDVSTIRGAADDKDTCPRCGGLVFHAEKMLSKSAVRKHSRSSRKGGLGKGCPSRSKAVTS